MREAVRAEDAQTGRNWLRYDFGEYWDQRKNLVEMLKYLASMEIKSGHRKEDARAARPVSGAVENGHV